MSPITTLLLALGMSVDSFVAALGKGAALHRPSKREAIRTGVVFGLVETLTPVLGWAAGLGFASFVKDIDHWIAFALLALVGGHMILEARQRHPDEAKPSAHSLSRLIITAMGTSVDAMAVGVSLAFLDVAIVPTALAIGTMTFLMVTIGVLIGHRVGEYVGKMAELFGGLGLIGLGAFILCEHLLAA